jgi:outer membrane protein assembly factor BamB
VLSKLLCHACFDARFIGALCLLELFLGCDKSRPSAARETKSKDPPTNVAASLSAGELPAGELPAGELRTDELRANDQLPNIGTRSRGADWPSFLGPTGDSKSTETGMVVPWTEGKPRIVWQEELGIGYGIGSVAAGRYFHFDRFDRRAGFGSARLTCREAETGKELWRFEYVSVYEDMLGYNNGPRASPVIDGNRVYIFGVEGMLHCLRATDGHVLWKVSTTEKFGVMQNFFGAGSTPAIFGDLLICMIGGSPPNSPSLYNSNGNIQGNSSGIVAFNKFTGAVEYSVTNELASYASTKLATIDGRPWCFMFCRGGLVGLDPRNGKVDFEYPWRAELLESVNASTPVVVGNEVFITETYQIGSSLLAVKPGGYEVVWSDEQKGRDKSFRAHWNTPIHVDGYLYGCTGRNSGDAHLRCIEWKTGKVMWSEETLTRSSLLYVDGHFVCLGEHGVLVLLKVNPEKCEIVSTLTLRSKEPGEDPVDGGKPRLLKYPCWSAPILSHGLMYVRGDDRVVCLDVIPESARE